jgi:hypothetical protein
MSFDQKVNFVTKTSGDGFWPDKVKTVRITRVELAYVDDDLGFGELRAYFDPAEWDVENDGLIYTDSAWMVSFMNCMSTLGFSDTAIDDISYSEQGMQEVDYVSMDVGEQFIKECEALYRWTINREAVNG